MEWIDDLNDVMTYIEKHLTDEISYDELAKLAHCSTYHFQRMFSYMAGVPLSEYIRRRRMSLAAVDLQTTDMKVIDIALKYGYNSPTAFNRAFKTIHQISPSETRNNVVVLSSFPPLEFTLSFKGVEKMNYRIEEKNELRIVGISEALSKNIEENFEVVPKIWNEFASQGILAQLIPLMNNELPGVLGVSACFTEEKWRYYLAVTSDTPCPEGLEEYTIPAFTWAVFSGSGAMPTAIQELEKRIVTEWLPTSGYEYANGPDIEVYLTPDPADSVFEVWIPVTKKK
ncbi:AraC family transcriptional regulator [Enterococcus sp. LJL99]